MCDVMRSCPWPVRVLVVVAVVVTGCSGRPAAAPASKPFSGTLQTVGGAPVGNVIVHFHPLTPGFASAAEVAADGTFSSEAPPGDYAWSVRRAEQLPSADVAIKAVSPRYQETDLGRTVRVTGGGTVALVVE